MHLNYHFLKFLCPEIERRIGGMLVLECFSQNKNELVIGFSDHSRQQYIRANLEPTSTCLSFPEDYKRSNKNSVTLFKDLLEDRVAAVRVLEFDRAFFIRFSSGKLLLFKMHGTRSNLLLFSDESSLPMAMFRNDLQEDGELSIDQLRNNIGPDWERFVRMEGDPSLFLPTLGALPREWLREKGYFQADSLTEKWKLMEALMDMLEHPVFSITGTKGKYQFTLLPLEETVFQSADPIVSANEFFKYAVVVNAFEREKRSLIKKLEDQKKKTQSYLKKTTRKLSDLESASPPQQLADIIMANLHQIPPGKEKVTLFDFYQNREIEVEIKMGNSPQKQAEGLYRKGKNRKIEVQQLRTNIQEKQRQLQEVEAQLEALQEIHGFKELRAFEKDAVSGTEKSAKENIPYKRFEIDGFELLVGKSAKSNDELLRHYCWKDDLWFHARNVAGSHAILKRQAGRDFPSTTIERAAELAAYYSKNKNESIAAVIYTPCKFVRKVKGSPPGSVKLDKESVVMVQPKGPGGE